VSQHDSQQDKAFLKTFSIVIGVLALVSIGAYILAAVITSDHTAAVNQQAVDARIKPVGNVVTDQPVVTETPASETPTVVEGESATDNATSTEPSTPSADTQPTEAVTPPADAEATETTEKPADTQPTEAATPPAEADETTEKPADTQPTEATTPPAEADETTELDKMTNDQAVALITEKGYSCMACHHPENKLVGPSYKEVAAKYKDDASAVETLAGKIKAGGSGTWGQMPMPPNPTVTDEDMQTLVDWILSLE